MATKRKTLPKDFDDLLKSSDLTALQAFFAKCELEARGGYDKGTALSFEGCPDDLARWLVGQGLDVDAPSLGARRTPLHSRTVRWAASIAVLIELGADLNARDAMNRTPMHEAVMRPHHLKELITAGADVDGGGVRTTPLRAGFITCENAHIHLLAESAELLLAAGATVPEDAQRHVARIGANFERGRSNFNPELVDETSAALQRLYELFDVSPVPRL